jgi:hypothetical protein
MLHQLEKPRKSWWSCLGLAVGLEGPGRRWCVTWCVRAGLMQKEPGAGLLASQELIYRADPALLEEAPPFAPTANLLPGSHYLEAYWLAVESGKCSLQRNCGLHQRSHRKDGRERQRPDADIPVSTQSSGKNPGWIHKGLEPTSCYRTEPVSKVSHQRNHPC